ncbi:MAG TPA: pilus (MSHA type) biogenesis protein MshL, partial [Gallionellaceae bacterium]|nr:pilus (MSHA type) biogenesis protein MshL [Gallionellaceae bacterium]
MKSSHALLYLSCALLAACGTRPIKPSDKHLQQSSEDVSHTDADIPQVTKRAIPLPPPQATPRIETYSVVVSNVPAQEILFALARDAKINLDVHAGIQGAVTLNAINQTLPQILNRIAKQVDMRYELDNGTLVVMPDDPYLKQYKIDYVNMARDSDSTVSNSSMLGTSSSAGAGATGVGATSNNSILAIKNSSKNHFWDTLTKNITDILRETDQILPDGSSETTVEQSRNASTTGTGAQNVSGTKKQTAKIGFENSPNPASIEEGGVTVTRRSTFREKASVISNPESGIITVRATARQHEKIQEFIDQVMTNARRQVLIEATIVEVRLSDNYKQGIDWSKFLAATDNSGFNISQKGTGLTPTTATAGTMIVNYINPASQYGSINASVSLLETFGNVKVLSSPKLSVMNNQTAMLRVVDNRVYFIVNSTTTPCSPAPCTPITTYTTTVNTVPIGFTMSLTPQINDNDTVLINVRPSITRSLTDVQDPTPNLLVANFIPQTSTREMESVLKIDNNQIAILGGLMEDQINKSTKEIPLLGRIPLIGNLFQNRDDTTTKTELVIFLHPIVIKDPSLNGDYK